jgi:hypothetical protein
MTGQPSGAEDYRDSIYGGIKHAQKKATKKACAGAQRTPESNQEVCSAIPLFALPEQR